MRLEGKVGIVVGAGQSPGETVGTGRAAALLFAREGASVLLADRDIDSARETAKLISEEGGVAECVEGDWTSAADCRAFASGVRGGLGTDRLPAEQRRHRRRRRQRPQAQPRRPSTA